MVIDMNYWSKVIRRTFVFLLSILGIYIAFKFAIFYIPFLIAFILSLIMEPMIKALMKKMKLKRKTSSIIVFIIILSITITLLGWGIVSLVTESYNLLYRLNDYFAIIANKVENITNSFDISKVKLPNQIISAIQNSAIDLLTTITEWTKNILTSLISVITSIPTVIIYVVITILSLYFITTDKIYILDQLEHHLPKIWIKKLFKIIKEISCLLGCYLKAQLILILISFVICLIGLYIYKIIGLNVPFPIIAALGIGFVDALPIFGSATAMIPWAIICALNGDIKLSIALLILLAIMAATKQMLEPKIVSNQIGIHPFFTLISMYTGFRIIGVLGLLLGPIILIILKTVFSKMIDKGVAKAIFERD